jgi:nitrite reductase/ring-hydroxylating ferredoxin subunit
MKQLVPVDVRLEPGQLLALEAGDIKIAVVNVDGEFFAFEDVCTHEQCPLSEGELDGDVVICDCHGGMFDVRTGEAIGGPPYAPLRMFRVRQVGAEINVEIDDDRART